MFFKSFFGVFVHFLTLIIRNKIVLQNLGAQFVNPYSVFDTLSTFGPLLGAFYWLKVFVVGALLAYELRSFYHLQAGEIGFL